MIVLQDVSKKYKGKQVLNNLSLQLKKGEITYIVGRNGAGKSTLMKAIMGLTPINKGSITVDETTKKATELISYVTEKNTFLPSFTIEKAFLYMKDFYPNWNEEKAFQLLTLFRLDEKQKIKNLSKGENMKLNVAIGLSLDVEYFLLDEPFSGMDALSKEELFSVMLEQFVGDQGVVITTHEIEEVKYWVDRVIILKDGKVAKDFYMEEMLEEDGRSIIEIWKEVEGHETLA